MTSRYGKRSEGFGRRGFLKGGAAFGLLAGGVGAGIAGGGFAGAQSAPGVPATIRSIRLMATDGFFSFPGRRFGDGNELYGFGFRGVDDIALETDDVVGDLVNKYKGLVHHIAPFVIGDEGDELALVVTNLGLTQRPDLDDSHSLHWHGFRNATAVYDGVPETSIAVPAGRDLPYYFNMKAGRDTNKSWISSSAGTYMYHCHFEDTEHVQMGMTSLAWIRPTQDVTARTGPVDPISGFNTWQVGDTRYCYNDAGTGVDTSFEREFALLFNEIDTTPHDNLLAVQEFVWSDYEPNYWTINGRSYPDTVELNVDPTGGAHENIYQPHTSLCQINAGEQGLLRLANLGYEVHSIELIGLRGRVVGGDASLLVDPAGNDLTFETSVIDIGPGEARDVIFTAPAYNATWAEAADGTGSQYNRYLIRNRNTHRNTNDGAVEANGLGGMVTEIRVYPPGTLAAQTSPNETYPTYAN